MNKARFIECYLNMLKILRSSRESNLIDMILSISRIKVVEQNVKNYDLCDCSLQLVMNESLPREVHFENFFVCSKIFLKMLLK